MRVMDYPTMTELWGDEVHRMWRGTLENGGIHKVAGIDTISYDQMLGAQSMAYDFDLRQLWLTRQRWTMLCRQYLDPSETYSFINRAAEIGTGEGKRGVVTTMFCRNVAREAKKHRWGNCMIGFTYRGLRNEQPVLAMHSRVSYIAYIGGLDLALAHVIARTIAGRIKVPVEDFQFRWHVDALQFHGFKSLPLLYHSEQYVHDLGRPKLRLKYPTIKIVGRWWDQIVQKHEDGVPLEAERYGPLKRIRRRYEEWMDDELQPSVPVADLTLDNLWR